MIPTQMTATIPYRNITISGIAGTGSTTLLKMLKDVLHEDGWTGYSGGEYMRKFLPELTQQDANHKAHHSAEDYGEQVDRQTDESIREQLIKEDGKIIESWLSGFMAQGVPGVLKILLICTNELDRANRLAARDEMTPADAMLQAYMRLEKNTRRWSRMYATEWSDWVVETGLLSDEKPAFFWHPNLYDLVIDTAVHDPQSCVEVVLATLRESAYAE